VDAIKTKTAVLNKVSFHSPRWWSVATLKLSAFRTDHKNTRFLAFS